MGGFKDLNRFGEMSPLRLLASAPDQAFHFWLHGVLEDLALYPLAQVARRVVLRIQLENRSDHGLRPFPIALRGQILRLPKQPLCFLLPQFNENWFGIELDILERLKSQLPFFREEPADHCL